MYAIGGARIKAHSECEKHTSTAKKGDGQMPITTNTIISWIILGFLAGSLAGMVFKRSKRGLGIWRNLLVGLVGAIVGSLVFAVLRIDLDVFAVTITFTGLVAAFVGSLIFLVVLQFVDK
jgi:uncharacterized membrane protein YeaQ/YmgE (transglycosylase-associated protein family)